MILILSINLLNLLIKENRELLRSTLILKIKIYKSI